MGDRVTVIGGSKNMGQTGRITRDDHDNSPYKIDFGSGEVGYFTEAQVRLAEVCTLHSRVLKCVVCYFVVLVTHAS